jgi:hypothetical protein
MTADTTARTCRLIDHIQGHGLYAKGIAIMRRLAIICAVLAVCGAVVFPAQAQEPTPAPPSVVAYLVIAQTANLRSGPSTDTAVLETASAGDRLLIYDEVPSTEGWLRVFRDGQADAFIADFLVERAPVTFYPTDQEPYLEVSGRGGTVTEVYEIPIGAYRVDATIRDQSFILQIVVIEGDCEDEILFNELNFDVNRLTISGLFVSMGCSVVFETENVNGEWELALRDIIVDDAFLEANTLTIENGTLIRGSGRALTMPTELPAGVWTVSAVVGHNAFILWPQVLYGDCDSSAVFNELDLDAEALEVSSVYRSTKPGCIIYWETSNVEGEWLIMFSRLG